jgi:phosphoesterase RecJ-like protein
MSATIQNLQALLAQPQRIVITMHERPDGDALGSSLGLAELLAKYDHHKIAVISPNVVPRYLSWLPGAADIIAHDKDKEGVAARKIAEATLIFCLDFSQIKRLGTVAPLVAKAKASKVIIDHHLAREDFADICIWDTKVPATAVLIYRVAVALQKEAWLDTSSATCLYTGILTDTGHFQHPTTTPEAHEIAAALVACGVKTAKVYRSLNCNNSLRSLKFTGHVLTHRLTHLRKLHAAYIAIPRADFVRFNVQAGETEGLLSHALSLQGVRCAVLLTEQRDSSIRLSFRSVEGVVVNTLAAEHFEGGGHANAAGGRSSLGLDATVARLTALLPSYLG